MHPLLKDWRSTAAWFAAWLPVGVVLGLIAAITGGLSFTAAFSVVAPCTFVLALLSLSPYSMCRAIPLRTASSLKLVGTHTIAAIVVSGLVMMTAHAVVSSLSDVFPELKDWIASASPVMAIIFLMLFLLSVALHYAFLEVEAAKHSELLAQEAQLRALKSQVNPHFLFNSLNSISALTSIDAEEARRMCVGLAEFLRASLRLGERTTVPLSEELDLTRMYLDVERVRFGGKLRVEEEIDPACAQFEVPALLIQPLVENAVKHGIAMMPEGGDIAMKCRRETDRITFTITNPYDPEAPNTGRGGIGLRNVRARLEARYGAAARMTVNAEPERYSVTLTFPARNL